MKDPQDILDDVEEVDSLELEELEDSQKDIPISTDNTTLNIVQDEINRIRKKQFNNEEVTYQDAKKLEALIKIRQVLHENPIDTVKPNYANVSDEVVLATIKQHLGSPKLPKKGKKK